MTYFAYAPGKGNSFGHTPRIKDQKKVWSSIELFMSKYAQQVRCTNVTLTIDEMKENKVDQHREDLIAYLLEKHGKPSQIFFSRGTVYQVNAYHRWEIDPHSCHDTISFVLDQFSKSDFNIPLWMSCYFYFRWAANCEGPAPVWVKEIEQCLGLFLGNILFMQPSFIFPYPEQDPKCFEYISEINRALPVNLTVPNFRMAERKKSGAGMNLRRIDNELKDRIRYSLS